MTKDVILSKVVMKKKFLKLCNHFKNVAYSIKVLSLMELGVDKNEIRTMSLLRKFVTWRRNVKVVPF